MIKKNVRQMTQGALRVAPALCVVAGVQIVKEHYVNVLKRSHVNQKAAEALLNDKMAGVRIGAKVERFAGTLQQGR